MSNSEGESPVEATTRKDDHALQSECKEDCNIVEHFFPATPAGAARGGWGGNGASYGGENGNKGLTPWENGEWGGRGTGFNHPISDYSCLIVV